MIVPTARMPVRAGLSLFEVLISLAIFLMSLVALSQLIASGGDLARDVQWLSRAMMIAESKMAEAVAGSLALSSVSETPCEEDDEFNWSMDAAPDSAPGLYRVTVTISRPRSDGSRFETTLTQLVLDPTVRGSATPPAAPTTTSTTGAGGTSP